MITRFRQWAMADRRRAIITLAGLLFTLCCSLFVGSATVAGILESISPATPTPTEKAIVIRTSTPVIFPTSTRTPTPTPTYTPRPTRTPRPTHTSTSTPTPTSTSRPTRTPHPTKPSAETITINLTDLDNLIAALNDLLPLLQNPRYEDQGWVTDVNRLADDIYTAYEGIQALDLPPQIADVHQALLEMGETCSQVASHARQAANNTDSQETNTALNLITTCVDELIIATDLIEQQNIQAGTPATTQSPTSPTPQPQPTAAPTQPPATPVPTQPPPTPVPTQPPAAVCDCSGDLYNCGDFTTQAAAQACYNYCWQQTGRDIHRLDGNDNDGRACESLP